MAGCSQVEPRNEARPIGLPGGPSSRGWVRCFGGGGGGPACGVRAVPECRPDPGWRGAVVRCGVAGISTRWGAPTWVRPGVAVAIGQVDDEGAAPTPDL